MHVARGTDRLPECGAMLSKEGTSGSGISKVSLLSEHPEIADRVVRLVVFLQGV